MLNMETLGFFESLEQLIGSSHVLSRNELIGDEGSLVNEMPETFLDISLRTNELSLQFNEVLHLAHRLVGILKPTASPKVPFRRGVISVSTSKKARAKGSLGRA